MKDPRPGPDGRLSMPQPSCPREMAATWLASANEWREKAAAWRETCAQSAMNADCMHCTLDLLRHRIAGNQARQSDALKRPSASPDMHRSAIGSSAFRAAEAPVARRFITASPDHQPSGHRSEQPPRPDPALIAEIMRRAVKGASLPEAVCA